MVWRYFVSPPIVSLARPSLLVPILLRGLDTRLGPDPCYKINGERVWLILQG